MLTDDDGYSLTDLARVADVTPRTVRYYISQGLLPAPTQMGTNARYGRRHLDRIRVIKRLQREHLPLAEIRSRLAALDDRQVADLARFSSPPTARSSALDYIQTLMPAAAQAPAAHRVLGRARTASPEPAPQLARPSLPAHSQWDRITLSPDVELHVRRPLTRHHNRLVDRLIAAARQLFEEERP